MANAENLINSLTDEEIDMYTISIESNGHIVIDNDRYVCVPDNLKRIAVQYDHNIETVTFDCPRYWDGIDMSTMIIYINYLRADNKLGSAAATNITIDEDDSSIMHFDWVITRNVSEANGPLSFLVCIKMVDSYGEEITHWNSELNKDMYVSEGLECSESIAESYPDVITQILATLSGNVGEGALNVTDVIDNLVTNNARKPLSAKQGMILKSLIDEVANEGIDEAQLSNAVETALAEAKANGDFKGEPGKDGAPGKDGKDGVSVSHKWEGTKLVVTSESGTSSADLKGDTGKTAYEYAVDMGYEGSEQDFADKMLREIPMYTSELNNDSGFIKNTELVSDLSVNDLYKALSAFAGWSLSTRLDNTEQNFKDITDDLDERLSAVADSDDETLNQLSEVVAYIKSNKSLIDSVTTSKVNVSDIVDDLNSTAKNKPLSASSGRLLKQDIGYLREQKLDKTELNSAINTALSAAKESGEFDGEAGKSGKDGKSAFDYAVEGGYSGSESVFAGKLADLANSQWQALITHVAEEYVIKDAVASFNGQNAWLQGINSLVVGKTYTVRWSGVEYTTTAFMHDEFVVIGNAGLIGGNKTGEPFCISAFENSKNFSLYKASSDEESIALSVFTGDETVVYNKLPKEYLPDDINVGSGSVGTEAVNADWLQNDADAKDYINNRTHYKEEIAEDVLFKLQTVNFTTSLTTIFGPGTNNIIEGESYTVKWNDNTYYLTAYNEFGDIMLGDAIHQPFRITAFSTTSALVEKNNSTAEDVLLAIYKGKPEIKYHKLDPRYMPEGYGYIVEENEREYLVHEMTLDFSTTSDGALRIDKGSPGHAALETGKTYNVYYDGIDYKGLVATEDSDDFGTMICIGNQSISSSAEEDTGEPFFYYYWSKISPEFEQSYPDAKNWLHRCIINRKSTDGSEAVSFAIYTETHTLEHKRFDARLMPEGFGAAETVQSDIAEIDQTSPSYVKHSEGYGYFSENQEIKHFDGRLMPEGYGYFEEPKTEVLIPETELEYDSSLNAWLMGLDDSSKCMIEDNEYAVFINDFEYSGIAKTYNMEGSSLVGFGNTIAIGGIDTGEPFFAGTIVMNNSAFFGVLDLTGATSVKASLVCKDCGITRFDGRLLPKGYGYFKGEPVLSDKIEFDGNYLNKEFFELQPGLLCVKLADNPVTKQQLIGATIIAQTPDGEKMIVLSEEHIQDLREQGDPVLMASTAGLVVVLDDTDSFGFTVPKGIYVVYMPEYVNSTEIVKSVTFTTHCIVKQDILRFDPNLIGDWVARKEPKSQEATVVSEMTVEGSLVDTYLSKTFTAGYNGHVTLIPGERYVVTINGNRYVCVAKTIPSMTIAYIGNLHFVDESEDSGEPFMYVNAADGGSTLIAYDSEWPATFSISAFYEALVPVKMPKDYLPDGVMNPIEKDVSSYEILDTPELQGTDVPGSDFCDVSRRLLEGSTVKVKYKFAGMNGNAIVSSISGGDLSNWAILHHGGFGSGADDLYIISVRTWLSENVAWINVYKLTNNVADDHVIINSSTEGSTKKFKLTVDDSGTISATEVTS